ncbi:pimeloyl-ACP methyl ester carboxylesterase [Prauserella shujinwangii]|uniref:Pimeloyl-ACP methyl ester carboxylesterase n=1 Tax=Prauserella shujinwangii TaxID=1453103 RepID=A0A2T0LYY8_9PSEU|nr:alpha/beta hydrolase [Prauserella shujinwangii]PRX49324.1 pimeloyl-ACP methyl ester carboxylesterase [Prauserella shujinwangii]
MRVQRGGERLLAANGVQLCVETFGRPGDPAVLLIAGAACSMDWWADEFCLTLAAGSRFVVRYDLRDTGRSVSSEPGAPDYTGADLVADAAGLLDALGLASAHVVGMSAGGGLAQHLATEHPDRVATLTLLSTSPAGPVDRELPRAADRIRRVFDEPAPEPDWSDRAAVTEYIAEGERPFAGSHPFDEEGMRDLAGRVFDRTTDIAASMTNHWLLADGPTTPVSLPDIAAPTLVLHGTEDPLFPFGHAEALADAIPGARLVPLERAGHELPPRPLWSVVIPAILEHTARARSAATREPRFGQASGAFSRPGPREGAAFPTSKDKPPAGGAPC